MMNSMYKGVWFANPHRVRRWKRVFAMLLTAMLCLYHKRKGVNLTPDRSVERLAADPGAQFFSRTYVHRSGRL